MSGSFDLAQGLVNCLWAILGPLPIVYKVLLKHSHTHVYILSVTVSNDSDRVE